MQGGHFRITTKSGEDFKMSSDRQAFSLLGCNPDSKLMQIWQPLISDPTDLVLESFNFWKDDPYQLL